MPQIDLIAIRCWTPPDYNFVKATWIRALRFGSSWFSKIDGPSYYKAYSGALDRLLLLPETSVKVACLADEPDVILGYAVSRNRTLDFVYVRKRWRGIGIAKSLVPSDFNSVTHLTETGKAIIEKNYPDVSFNPFQ